MCDVVVAGVVSVGDDLTEEMDDDSRAADSSANGWAPFSPFSGVITTVAASAAAAAAVGFAF